MDAENKEKIEEILKNYPVLRSELDMTLISMDLAEVPLDSVDYSKPSVSKTNKIHSDVEQYIESISELEEEARELMKIVKTIERALDCLYKKEYRVIELKFFEGMTFVEMELEMKKSKSTLQKYKKSAIKKLKKVNLQEIYCKTNRKLT